MSPDRFSSGVRNLRSIFENKGSEADTPDRQERSPGDLAADETKRPLSKVRSSFVTVGSRAESPTMDTSHMPELARQSSAARRRPSFSQNEDNYEELENLKRIVSEESEKREREPGVQETIPEAAIESTPEGTPRMQPRDDRTMGDVSHTTSKLSEMTVAGDEDSPPADPDKSVTGDGDLPPVNPDKPVTGAEEEPSGLTPADPADEGAVSGGAALPPVVEDLRKEKTSGTPEINGNQDHSAGKPNSTQAPTAKKPSPTTKTNPPAASTQTAPKAAREDAKRPAGAPSSAKTKAPRRDLNRKVSRPSLAAPTAASSAKAAGAETRESLPSTASPSVKPKPREPTKAVQLSSHLLAPTASSRAKHDTAPPNKHTTEPSAATVAARPRPKPGPGKPTPRSSLAPQQRSESRTSQNSSRRSAAPDGSFLDRMMRPTASSQSKSHDKFEKKSPPRTSTSANRKPATLKTNGVARAPKEASQASESTASGKQDAPAGIDGNVEQVKGEPAPGNETPVHQTDAGMQAEATAPLESTPAFSEEAIR